MTATDILYKRIHRANEDALAIVKKHGTEERRAALQETTFNSIPGINQPDLFATLQAQLLVGLAEIVEGLVNEKTGGKSKSTK